MSALPIERGTNSRHAGRSALCQSRPSSEAQLQSSGRTTRALSLRSEKSKEPGFEQKQIPLKAHKNLTTVKEREHRLARWRTQIPGPPTT